MDTRVAAGGTLIRRYALAPTPAGAGIEAAVTAASVPPLSGGPGSHGSEAAHAFTIADSVAEPAASPLRLRRRGRGEGDDVVEARPVAVPGVHGEGRQGSALAWGEPVSAGPAAVISRGKETGWPAGMWQ
jgi:hypothetical protein